MFGQIRAAVVSTLLFTLLLGLAYPLAITGIAHVAMPAQAEGSLIRDRVGHVIGSALIGQPFAKAEYLHPRPSAAGKGYDATGSSGSNLGPLSDDLIARVKTDTAAVRASTGGREVPEDAVTTSGSGLDPDISPTYARIQAERIAAARGVAPAQVRRIIEAHVDGQFLGFIGQPHVNVLKTNLALDAAFPNPHLSER